MAVSLPVLAVTTVVVAASMMTVIVAVQLIQPVPARVRVKMVALLRVPVAKRVVVTQPARVHLRVRQRYEMRRRRVARAVCPGGGRCEREGKKEKERFHMLLPGSYSGYQPAPVALNPP